MLGEASCSMGHQGYELASPMMMMMMSNFPTKHQRYTTLLRWCRTGQVEREGLSRNLHGLRFGTILCPPAERLTLSLALPMRMLLVWYPPTAAAAPAHSRME